MTARAPTRDHRRVVRRGARPASIFDRTLRESRDLAERWHGADSIDLLRTAIGTIGGRIVNIDATVVCEEPKLAPHRAEMERMIAEATSARVSVKATTNEGMGWVGRGEGIACIAVASIEDE